MKITEWADSYRVLSTKESAEPGKWRTSRYPFLGEIMDCLSPSSPVWKVAFMKACQIGGTEVGNNWLSFIIDLAPAPMLLVHPTIDLAKKYSKQRLDPMVNNNPRLSGKVVERRSRDNKAASTLIYKEFPGGMLSLIGSGSGAGYRQQPAKYVWCDDADGYEPDVAGEGHPIDLAIGRTTSYSGSRRKIYISSTPTIEGQSNIAEEYENSDKRRYYIPCYRCDYRQVLAWPQLKWPHRKPKLAEYECSNCSRIIPERKKTEFLEAGIWVAEVPELSLEVAGFHISALYAPLGKISWGDLANEFAKKHRNPEKLKTFVNIRLAETWKGQGDAPEWKQLYIRRGGYSENFVPKGAIFLTGAVDVQQDRLVIEIKGWGRRLVSWSIAYIVLAGKPTKDQVWRDLDNIIVKTWERIDDGPDMPVTKWAIDAGDESQRVYNYVRKWPKDKVHAIRGSDSLAVPISIPKVVDVKESGKRKARGCKVWPVGSSHIKKELYGFLKQDPPVGEEEPATGFCYFPEEYTEAYFLELTAEQLVPRKVKGYIRYYWEKIRDRNEALDLAVYNRAMASLVGIDRFNAADWQRMEQKIIPAIEPPGSITAGEKRTINRKKSWFWS